MMEVIIKGSAKEIAALVLEVQRQQTSKIPGTIREKSSSEEFYRGHGITQAFS